MTIVDRGTGPALVLVPGIQGRWEYMRPAVDALSRAFRVLTFSLKSDDLDGHVREVHAALAGRGVDRAVICGVSFGGVVAARFAAIYPERTRALVLVSTPAPGWRLPRRHRLYARLPWLLGPLFLVESPWRMRAELHAAFPDGRTRRAFKASVLRTLLSAPISLGRMAARARLIDETDLRSDCARIDAPTLLVTGEPALDHVVPVDSSREFVRLIRGARAEVIASTGHIGSVTRPDAFVALVSRFVEGTRHAAA
ncbi:MAG: alpha/beta hydrolase [Acidobacteriia bacterium]|nr:alpha/beta hydrolase [Terriglobia bacterium]